MNRKFNRFGRGGCFICRVCRRNTRETGGDHVQAELCEQCWELAGIDNHCNNHGVTGAESPYAAEAEMHLSAIARLGGPACRARARASCGYIWPGADAAQAEADRVEHHSV
jgi:hypothetical protein